MPQYIFDICVIEWKSLVIDAGTQLQARQMAEEQIEYKYHANDVLELKLRKEHEEHYDLFPEL